MKKWIKAHTKFHNFIASNSFWKFYTILQTDNMCEVGKCPKHHKSESLTRMNSHDIHTIFDE